MSKISVVLPVYNEEELIESSYKRVTKALAPLKKSGDDYELIFVDDGCRDKSLSILKKCAKNDKHAKIVSFARNFGHQTAITAGMQYATGDAVVTIDADMQDPPELIIDMVAKWREGYDVVYGKHKKRPGESVFKKITAHVYYRMLNKFTTIDFPTDSGDFRLFDRKVADAMNSLPEKNRYIRGLMVWVGFKHIGIEFDREERKAGETKYPLKKMLKFAADGLLSFSYSPMRGLWKTGVFGVILAFIAGILLLIFQNANAVLILSTVGTFLTSVLLIGMGILGAYIARITDETRGRPQFTVRELVNF